jgi:hypothetical protein
LFYMTVRAVTPGRAASAQAVPASASRGRVCHYVRISTERAQR